MIEKYLSELEARGLAKNTVKSYKQVLTALNGYRDLESIEKKDLIGFFQSFKGTDASRQLYAVIIKTYFKSIGKANMCDWLTVKKPKETLRHDEILNADDVNAMIASTDSTYWKCLLALMYETGARIGELLTLKYSDFQETDKGIVLTITTHKTSAGFRKMLIPLTENYFVNLRDSTVNSKSSLVFNLDNKNPLTLYRWVFDVTKEIGRRAKISKPCNPHSFRHARATDEVRKGTQEAIIRKKLGWSNNSMMIARYQHLSDDDIINSQIDGSHIMKRTELKTVEKADVTPIYEGLQEENRQLKARLDGIERLLSSIGAPREQITDSITFDKEGVTIKGHSNKELTEAEEMKLKEELEAIVKKAGK